MKTEYQILQEITRLENLNVSPDVDYLARINALAWVLDGEESAMCEANSNAVLDAVRAYVEENRFDYGGPFKMSAVNADDLLDYINNLCEHGD